MVSKAIDSYHLIVECNQAGRQDAVLLGAPWISLINTFYGGVPHPQ